MMSSAKRRSSDICPGVEVVDGRFGRDAPGNLLSYVKSHLGKDAAARVHGFLQKFERALSNNEPLDIRYNTITHDLPEQHRDNVEALIRDLEVHFLEQRYDLLRKINSEKVDRAELEHLLEEYCLGRTWRVDPEVPRVVARLVVHHMTQWDLMCLLHDRIRDCIADCSETGTINGEGGKARLASLGRLIAFLRWVPYDWVEDVLLSFLDRIRFGDSIADMRFHVSVMRALFCRRGIRTKTIEHLCTHLCEHFGGTPPAALRTLLRAVLIAGGADAWRFLHQKLHSDPQRYLTGFFLESMVVIDKAATARLLHEHKDAILKGMDSVAYIDLLAATGERGGPISDEVVGFWDGARRELKISILRAIDELHCTRACSFLVKMLHREEDTDVQMMMLDTIAAVGELGEVMDTPSQVGRSHPILFYHAIDLCYRRLLSEPVMLTRLRNYEPLLHFEVARAQIYQLYRFLYRFFELLGSLEEILTLAQRAGIPESVRVESDYSVAVDQAALGTSDTETADRVERLVQRVRALYEEHGRKVKLAQTLGQILDFAASFNPRYSDDVFGRTRLLFSAAKVLHRADFEQFGSPGDTGGALEPLSLLREKAQRSITLVQEYFLYKEWFIRKAPFVLHDDMPGILDRIRGGEELGFDPDAFLNQRYKTQLRETFEVFNECTKQGVYLTDILLEYLLQFPPKERARRVQEDLTHHRSRIARGEERFDPNSDFERHLQFTTFAHRYRYGKESTDRPSIIYLWLRFADAMAQLRATVADGGWPRLPRHGEMRAVIGPLVEKMYRQQQDEAYALRDFIMAAYDRCHRAGMRIRVIPNMTYGLFCVAPILMDLVKKGIHVSLAGVSSRYCDDMNISQFTVAQDALCPIKPYLFSTASNFGTVNHDRVLIVVDGTMEPLDRHQPGKIRLPKAYRGYLDHIVAVNYVRSRYGYGMEDPEREVASALNLSVRYVRNLARTVKFEQLVRSLLLSFDREELEAFHRRMGTGRTYYSFAQWNPEGRSALIGSRGYRQQEVHCARVRDVRGPMLLFVNMNGFSKEGAVPAFFDNNPEVEKSRIIIGPDGVRLDTGWPHEGEGIVVRFPEGENR